MMTSMRLLQAAGLIVVAGVIFGRRTSSSAQNEPEYCRGRRLMAVIAALLTLLAMPEAVLAQTTAWPTRPVRFIVPFGPGAGADIGARLFGEKLTQRWGQPVVVENRPGGDSLIAITAFLNADDDHTFLYIPTGNFTAHPFMHVKLSYNPQDLVPIVQISNTAMVSAVANVSPYANIGDFTAAARANPAKLNSALVSGVTEFAFWSYAHHEGLNITQVPYRDITQAPNDLAEDRIQIVVASLAVLQPQWRAGRVKLIALNNTARTPLLPDLPTVMEQGYPSLTFDGLHGLIGPKTMSQQFKERIANDFRDAAADGTIASRMAATGQVINIAGPDEFASAIEQQRATVAQAVQSINFKAKN